MIVVQGAILITGYDLSLTLFAQVNRKDEVELQMSAKNFLLTSFPFAFSHVLPGSFCLSFFTQFASRCLHPRPPSIREILAPFSNFQIFKFSNDLKSRL
jgi:hypothetical protein